MTAVGGNAFEWCDISEVSIPNTVTKIGDYAFAQCDYLTQITFHGKEPPNMKDNIFIYSNALHSIIVPTESDAAYTDSLVKKNDIEIKKTVILPSKVQTSIEIDLLDSIN